MLNKKIFLGFIIFSGIIYAGDNLYQGDGFNKRHSAVKESFIKSVAKNRAHSKIGHANYTEIHNKKEFKDALKSGKLKNDIKNNGITNDYNVVDIKNVRINKNDLKDIKDKKLLIGSQVDKSKEKVMQTINIKNSKIETDKELTIGVKSTTNDVEGIKNISNIEGSSIKGGKKIKNNEDIDRLKLFEELEKADKEYSR
jgi:hypothetical protein